MTDLVKSAMDDGESAIWIIHDGSENHLEEVEIAGAMGGTALKVTVPANESFEFSRYFLKSALVDFRVFTDDASFAASGALTLLPANLPTGFWTNVEVEVVGNNDAYLNWRVNTANGAGADRVFFLDSLRVEEGLVLKVSGEKAIPSITPSQRVYQPGDWVTLDMEPAGGADAFGGWVVSGGKRDFPKSFDWKVDRPTTFKAYGATSYEFEGVSLVVPSQELEATDLGGGADRAVRLARAAFRGHGYAALEAAGPGFAIYSIKRAESVEGAESSFADVLATDGYEERAIWIPAGVERFSVPTLGSVEIKGLRFQAGFPIDWQVDGRGAVLGAPPHGRADLNELVALTAVPAEGWEFSRWTGDVQSLDLTLALVADRGWSVRAVFEQVLEFDEERLVASGDMAWSLAAGGTRLRAPSQIPAGSSSLVEWLVKGPGKATIRFECADGFARVWREDASRGALERHFVGGLDPYQAADHDGKLEFELVSGYNRIGIEPFSATSFDTVSDLEILGFDFEPGSVIEVNAAQGGSVVGVPSARVPAGEVVNIEAKPDAGYRFAKWTGSVQSSEPILNIQVDRPLSLRAEFERIVEDDSWVDSAGGAVHWQRVGGRWKMPASLEEGEKAWIEGTVAGPCRLYVSFDSSPGAGVMMLTANGESFYRDNGETSWWAQLPDGPNLIRIEAIGSARYNSATLQGFDRAFLVLLESRFGQIETDFDFPYNSTAQLKEAYIVEGTVIEYAAKPLISSGPFYAWTGELSGKPGEGSFEVLGPVRAQALMATERFPAPHGELALTPGSAFAKTAGIGIQLYPTGLADRTTLAATVEGPGSLRLNLPEGATVDSVLVGGVPSAFAEAGIIDLGPGSQSFQIEIAWADFEGFAEFDYRPGYRFDAGIFFGGRYVIDGNVSGGYASPGASYTISATPNPLNRFARWIGDVSSASPKISGIVSGPMSFRAVFEAQPQLNGTSWVYDGTRPFVEIEPWLGGSFRWVFDPRIAAKTGKATAQLQGPAEMRFRYQISARESMDGVSVLLDGKRISLESGSVSEVKRHLAPGNHTLVYEIDSNALIEANGHWGGILLGFPLMDSVYTIRFKGEGTDIEANYPNVDHAYGAKVSVVAPERNDRGDSFQGWWKASDEQYGNPNLGAGTIASRARSLSVTVTEDVTYVAAYAPAGVSSGAGLINTWGGHWRIAAGAVGPTGKPALVASREYSETGGLDVVADGDSVVRFWARCDSPDESAVLLGEIFSWSFRDFTIIDRNTGWTQCAIPLRAGEALSLKARAQLPSGAQCWVSDVVVEAGWSPWIIGAERLDISVEGDTATLSIKEEFENRFYGWLGLPAPLTGAPQPSIEISRSSHSFVIPLLALRENLPIGSVAAVPDFAWEFGASRYGTGQAWIFEPSAGQADGFLELEIDGPAVLAFRAAGNGTAIAEVDGVPGEIQYDSGTQYLNVPEGNHRARLRCSGTSAEVFMEVALVDLKQGSLYQGDRLYEGGFVAWSRAGMILELGSVYKVAAIPEAGYEFVAWEGPFADRPRRFELAADGREPKPIFQAKNDALRVQLDGIDWRLRGLRAEALVGLVDGRTSVNWRLHRQSLPEQWVETTLVGPGVLRLSPYAVRYELDGVAFEHPAEIGIASSSGLSIPLGEGEHSLRATLREDVEFIYLGELAQYERGHLLVARGIGVGLIASPDLTAYPEGARVRLYLSGATDVSQVDWQGLPANAEVGEGYIEFSISETTIAKAMRWRDIKLLDRDVRHAGNSEWISDADAASRAPLSYHDEDWLELSIGGNEIWRVVLRIGEYSTGSQRVDGRLWVDGASVPLSLYSADHDEYFEFYVAPGGQSREVRWELFDLSTDFAGEERSIELEALGPADSADMPEFVRWWFEGRAGVTLAYGDLWLSDEDGDGVVAYEEFKFGLDPRRAEPLLLIRPDASGTGLELVTPAFLESSDSPPVFEHKAGFGAPWIDDGSVIGAPIPDPADAAMLIRSLQMPNGGNGTQLFRVKWDIDIPSPGETDAVEEP